MMCPHFLSVLPQSGYWLDDGQDTVNAVNRTVRGNLPHNHFHTKAMVKTRKALCLAQYPGVFFSTHLAPFSNSSFFQKGARDLSSSMR